MRWSVSRKGTKPAQHIHFGTEHISQEKYPAVANFKGPVKQHQPHEIVSITLSQDNTVTNVPFLGVYGHNAAPLKVLSAPKRDKVPARGDGGPYKPCTRHRINPQIQTAPFR